MKRFGVFSGFLGSGKTTTMMALTEYVTRHHVPAAMITNDLGSEDLADHRLALLSGIKADEMVRECICYRTDELVRRLDRFFDEEGVSLVISDIPGFGVGALDHVYHTLAEKHAGRFELAPFTVLTEPRVVRALATDADDEMSYILHAQLLEADLIVLNKCDLLAEEETDGLLAFLESRYPAAQVLAISAVTGRGLPELAGAILKGNASLRRPDIGYGGERFRKAMNAVNEYNMQYYVRVCCDDFDANAYLLRLAEDISRRVHEAGAEIPHLKVLAWEPEGDFGKVDALGYGRPVEVTRRFSRPQTDLAVILNTSALCSGELLKKIFREAVHEVSQDHQLEVSVLKRELPMD